MDTVSRGATPRLGPNDVHVWFADLSRNRTRLATLESYLGADERARADRYHFRLDYDRFVCTRGILRELLGTYTGQHPACLRFTYNPFGKPFAVKSDRAVPRFNCSRSADIALFAFTLSRDVGIDIEHIENDEEFLNIALQYYTRAEIDVLKMLEGQARMAEFFRYWTRREAYLKATGVGLSYLSAELDVSDSLVRQREGVPIWTIKTFDAVPGYASSVASAGTDQVNTILDYAASTPPAFDLRTAG